MQSLKNFPKIGAALSPLKKENACTAIEIACLARVRALRRKAPKITHKVAVLLLSLAFHTGYPDRVSNAVNIFMFLDLSLEAGTKAVLVARRWDTALESNTLTSYADTAALMTKQRIFLIMR